MSQQPQAPSGVNFHGAVDLSALRRPQPPAAPRPGGASGATPEGIPVDGFVREVSEETFQDVVELSLQVPVVIDLWATWCEPCKQLSPVLEKLAEEYQGAFLLATVDVDQNQQIAAAFQAQSIPTVAAVVKGQPVPLFVGAYPEDQVRQILDQLVEVARSNGVTGRLVLRDEATAAEDAGEPEIPAHHREAQEALARNDLPAATEAYRAALADDPADAEARTGLARLEVLGRVHEAADPTTVRARAAGDPHDVEAQLAAADLDVAGGHVEDAFSRIVALVAATRGDDRDRARVRLLELFEAVGPADPRVSRARVALTNALY